MSASALRSMYGRHAMVGERRQCSASRASTSRCRRSCADRLVDASSGASPAPRQRDERRLALVRASCGRTLRAPTDAEPHAARQLAARGRRSVHGDPVVAVAVVAPLAGRRARSRTAGGSSPAPRPGRSKHVAMRSSVPCAQSRRRARAGSRSRPLVGLGRPDDEQVLHRQPAGRRVPRRLEHVRAGHVAALVGHRRVRRAEAEEARRGGRAARRTRSASRGAAGTATRPSRRARRAR